MEKLEYSNEIVSIAALESLLGQGDQLVGLVFSGLDLRQADLEQRLMRASFDDTLFLGCQMSSELSTRVKATGGLVFPLFEDLPFDPYRSELYSVAELMEGYVRGRPETLDLTLDARIFQYYKTVHAPGMRPPVLETLACRIHDHAIDCALDDLLRPEAGEALHVVGIMGGHKLRRDHPGYRAVARIAQRLTAEGLFVATGGGPGAMEAGNLGAWFGSRHESSLETAVSLLEPDPWYLDPHYVDRAFDVLDTAPTGDASLSVPTWFYGHEPCNLFSSSIAKYFANSIREDGLLAIATYGVIFSPGSAGTIQEIFQDAAQNHYASLGTVSPMVFLGADYWTRYRPVFDVMKAMSAGKPYAKMITVTDDPGEAVRFILDHPPLVIG